MSYVPTTWIDGETPVNAENLNKLESAVQANDDAIYEINTARENGEFNGEAGKSAYEYAQAGGYTGTEEEFTIKLASESSYIHIGTEAPTDENVSVWIDTDEEAEAPGGVSSWNDLTDKPFGEEAIDPNWDGDMSGRVVLPLNSTISFVKISDYVPTEEECVSTVMSYVAGGHTETVTISSAGVIDGSAMFGFPCFTVSPDEFSSGAMYFPFVAVVKNSATVQGLEVSSGTYYLFKSDDSLYVSFFSALNKEIVKKLDAKYLPEEPKTHSYETGECVVPLGAFGIDEGGASLQYGKVIELGQIYVVTFNGKEYLCEGRDYGDGVVYIGSYGIVNGNDTDMGYESTDYPFGAAQWGENEWELYCPEAVSSTVTFALHKATVQKIHELYLPIVDHILVRSSDSHEVYELTVNGDGAGNGTIKLTRVIV